MKEDALPKTDVSAPSASGAARKPRSLARHIVHVARAAGRDQAGASAIEFTLLAPVLVLLFAGAADFGGMVYTRLGLESSVSAAANYSLVNVASISSAQAGSFVSNVAAIAANSWSSGWADVGVTINGGATGTVTGGTAFTSGSTASANSCYCPTLASGAVAWGAAMACGSACANGGTAGKFVTLSASRVYTPLFSGYGFVSEGRISAAAVVQAQ